MRSLTQSLERGAPSEEGLPYSSYVRAGDFVYLSGLVGFGDDCKIVTGGIVAETRQVMDTAGEILQRAQCSFSDVVKVNICLPDPDDFDEFNEVYASYFDGKHPARATICAGLTIDAKVEIEMVAYKPIDMKGGA
ncbi:RidA family protein [Aliamphritea ceti]|uniref:RidA family protein n=1 Tax=Aliamphritea ceti TaxID=1524258 RepID=UPI0021C28AFF|nr:RidA family protein [Aliamphritea ceti]